MRFVLLICVTLLGFTVAQAAPDKRVALVVGNGAYKELHALDNPGADAGAVAQMLSQRGFEVISCDGKRLGCFDLTRDGLSSAIEQLRTKSQGAELAFVFYAGHGVQAAEGNVLVPVDADVDCATQQVARGVLVDEVLEALSGAAHKIVVLDACRNNPLGDICPPATKAKLTFRDFKVPDAGNFLLVSSTKPGQVALDGLAGEHSPFARALLAALLVAPNVHFDQIFSRVSKTVIEETSKASFTQIPEMLVRGGVPEDCLAGRDCAADPRAAALQQELTSLQRELARDQELGETAKDYLAQIEKQRGKLLSDDERRVELAALREATRSLAARNDKRGERALELLKTGDKGEAEKLFQEDLDAEEAEAKAEATRQKERRKKAAASARNIAALAKWKDSARALAYYKHAADLDPDDAQTWIDYAQAAITAGHQDEARDALNQAEAKAGSDPASRIRFETARGKGGIAAYQGKLSDALQFYREAQQEAERLAAREPKNEERRFDLADTLALIGRLQGLQSDISGQLESYRAATDIAERLAKASPNNPKWQFALSGGYNLLGGVLSTQGNYAQANERYRAALEIAERLDKLDPGNAEWKYWLADDYENVGEYRKAADIYERFAKADPGNAIWQLQLALSYDKLAAALSSQGKIPQALQLYKDSTAIEERFVKADPFSAPWQAALSANHTYIGAIYTIQGDFREALQAYNSAQAIQDRFARADPGNKIWQIALATTYSFIARAHFAVGSQTQALQAERNSLEILERLVKSGNVNQQSNVAAGYLLICDILRQQGNLLEALKACRAGTALREQLASSDPSDTGWQGALASAYESTGSVLTALDDLPAALQVYRDSLEIRKRLATTDPGDAVRQASLAVTYVRIGGVLKEQDNLAEALQAYRNSLEIVERLATADPSNARLQWGLAFAQDGVSEVLERQGDAAGALEHRQAAGSAYRKLEALYARTRDDAYYAYAAGDYAEAVKAQAKKVAAIETAEREATGKPGPDTAGALDYLSTYRMYTRDFKGALEAANRSLSVQPGRRDAEMNKADALMLLGRAKEARAIYLRYKGQRPAQGGKLWEKAVLDDFSEAERRGLKHPQMAEIRKLLAAKQTKEKRKKGEGK